MGEEACLLQGIQIQTVPCWPIPAPSTRQLPTSRDVTDSHDRDALGAVTGVRALNKVPPEAPSSFWRCNVDQRVALFLSPTATPSIPLLHPLASTLASLSYSPPAFKHNERA